MKNLRLSVIKFFGSWDVFIMEILSIPIRDGILKTKLVILGEDLKRYPKNIGNSLRKLKLGTVMDLKCI